MILALLHDPHHGGPVPWGLLIFISMLMAVVALVGYWVLDHVTSPLTPSASIPKKGPSKWFSGYYCRKCDNRWEHTDYTCAECGYADCRTASMRWHHDENGELRLQLLSEHELDEAS